MTDVTKDNIVSIKAQENSDALSVTLNTGQVWSVSPGSRFWPAIQAWRDAGGVVEPAVTESEALSRLQAHVKSTRDAKEQGVFTYNSWRFDADPISVARINGVSITAKNALDAGTAFSVSWTDADNQSRELDASMILDMQQALVVHADACHQAAKAIKVDVSDGIITTEAEIDADPRWPANR